MRALLLTLPVLAFTACAHSGVVPVGSDVYMIANSEWGFTSGGYQKAKAIQEASEFCGAQGKAVHLISSHQNDVELGKTPAAEVQFRCVNVQPVPSQDK